MYISYMVNRRRRNNVGFLTGRVSLCLPVHSALHVLQLLYVAPFGSLDWLECVFDVAFNGFLDMALNHQQCC